MQCYDAGAGAELLNKLCGLAHDVRVFDDLSLAHLAGAGFDPLSWDNATDVHTEIHVGIAGIFGAFDKILTDGVRHLLGKEQQFSAVFYDGIASAGIAVPGLEKAGPVEPLL